MLVCNKKKKFSKIISRINKVHPKKIHQGNINRIRSHKDSKI